MQKLLSFLALSLLALSSGCSCSDVSEMITVLTVQDIVEVDIAGVTTYPTVDLLVAVDSGSSTAMTPPEFHMTEVLIQYDFGLDDPNLVMPPLAMEAQVDLEDGQYDEVTVYAALSEQIYWMIENFGVDGSLEGGAANISVKGHDACDNEVWAENVDDFLITFTDFIDD